MWFKWFLIGMWALESLIAIGIRKEGGERIITLLLNCALAAGLLYYWGR